MKYITLHLTLLLLSCSVLLINCSKKSDPAPATSTPTPTPTTCSTAGCFKFNDGSSDYSSSNITATKSGNNIIITAPTGATDYPTVYLYIITNGSTGTFTSSYATIKYDVSTTYNSVSGGSFSTTINSNTATGSAGTFTFTGKLGANSKTVTGSFNVVY